MDTWGQTVAELGGMPLYLFGPDRDSPLARLDQKTALLWLIEDGARIVAMNEFKDWSTNATRHASTS